MPIKAVRRSDPWHFVLLPLRIATIYLKNARIDPTFRRVIQVQQREFLGRFG
jgi:hypothetical protein